VKLAVAFPAATVIVAGRVTVLTLLESLTLRPLDGAMPDSVMAPVELDPPVRVEGFKLTDWSTGGVTVIVAVSVAVPAFAITVATFWFATAVV
jgi:hypothetical protein